MRIPFVCTVIASAILWMPNVGATTAVAKSKVLPKNDTVTASIPKSSQHYLVVDLRKDHIAWCPTTVDSVNLLQRPYAVYSIPASVLSTATPDNLCATGDGDKRAKAESGFPPYSLGALLDCARTGDCPTDLLSCKCPSEADAPEPSSNIRDYAAWVALDWLSRNPDAATDRWISTKGDRLRMIVIVDKGVKIDNPKVTEKARKPQIALDLTTLLSVISTLTAPVAAAPESAIFDVLAADYDLANARAELTIEVQPKATGDANKDKSSGGNSGTDSAPMASSSTGDHGDATKQQKPTRAATDNTTKSSADEPANSATAKIVTGPIERLFLSADVPLSSGKQLSYAADTKTIATHDDPTAAYVGVNHRLGDLYEDDTFWKKIVLKGLIAASRHPTNGYGFGVGLRGDLFGKWGIDLDAFSPFCVWLSVKNTPEAVAAGAKKRSSGVRFGLSFNLDKAVDWLKPKAKKDPATSQKAADSGDMQKLGADSASR